MRNFIFKVKRTFLRHVNLILELWTATLSVDVALMKPNTNSCQDTTTAK